MIVRTLLENFETVLNVFSNVLSILTEKLVY